jgi:hypothetical protein
LQGFRTTPLDQLRDRLAQAADCVRGTLIGAHTKRVGALGGQQPRDLLQAAGDILIQLERCHLERAPCDGGTQR